MAQQPDVWESSRPRLAGSLSSKQITAQLKPFSILITNSATNTNRDAFEAEWVSHRAFLPSVLFKDGVLQRSSDGERNHFCRWVSHYSLQTELAQNFKHLELWRIKAESWLYIHQLLGWEAVKKTPPAGHCAPSESKADELRPLLGAVSADVIMTSPPQLSCGGAVFLSFMHTCHFKVMQLLVLKGCKVNGNVQIRTLSLTPPNISVMCWSISVNACEGSSSKAVCPSGPNVSPPSLGQSPLQQIAHDTEARNIPFHHVTHRGGTKASFNQQSEDVLSVFKPLVI